MVLKVFVAVAFFVLLALFVVGEPIQWDVPSGNSTFVNSYNVLYSPGNPFDQSLNTSDSPTFVNVDANNVSLTGDSSSFNLSDGSGNFIKMYFDSLGGFNVAMLEGNSLTGLLVAPLIGLANGLIIRDMGFGDMTITFYSNLLADSANIWYDDANDDLVIEDIDTLVADSDFKVTGDSLMEGDLDMDGNDIDSVRTLNADYGYFSENVTAENLSVDGLNIGRYNDSHWRLWG